jgi:membrane-associated phospholipid phosphatase
MAYSFHFQTRSTGGRRVLVVKLEGTVVVAAAMALTFSSLPCRAQDPEGLEGPPAPKAFDSRPLVDAPNGDGRRTMGAFPKNLGRNFVGVFSGQNLLPFAVGAAATVSASAFDSRAKNALQGSCNTCGTTGASMGGAAVVPVVGAMFLAGRFAPQGRFRSATYDFAQAAIVNGAYTSILKYSVQRTRPDESNRLSFPSGHTSTAFSLATVANQHYGWKVGVPAYLLASGIGLSRIEKDKHYLSDVLAGATLGVIVGRTVARLDGERPSKKRQISVGPATDPHGQGVGLTLSASW